MVKDEALIELAHPKYWNERYNSQQQIGEDDTQPILGSYEWFRNFEDLRPFFTKSLPASVSECHILHLGCGNSTLTADLHTLGYTNQTSVDFSQVVIDAMKLKYLDLKTRWYVMDVRKLQMPNESVDVAIDKGTLDAMIHGSLWDPPADVRSNVGKYVDEVARILKPGGQWLYITYRQPHFIKPLLAREDLWTLSVEVLGDTQGAGVFEYFGFTMKRHQSLLITPIAEAHPCVETYSGMTIDTSKSMNKSCCTTEGLESTPASMDNLALVLESEGKYEEAEQMHLQALERMENVLGQEYPQARGG